MHLHMIRFCMCKSGKYLINKHSNYALNVWFKFSNRKSMERKTKSRGWSGFDKILIEINVAQLI